MARVQRLCACALAFCAIAAPAALADPPDVSVTISGIVERTHADTSGGPRAITVLSTPSGPQAVTFDADQPVPPNGADVDLRGRLVGATLQTDSVTITGSVPAETLSPTNWKSVLLFAILRRAVEIRLTGACCGKTSWWKFSSIPRLEVAPPSSVMDGMTMWLISSNMVIAF